MITEILLSVLLKFSSLKLAYLFLTIISLWIFAFTHTLYSSKTLSKWMLRFTVGFALLTIASYYAPTPNDLIEARKQMKAYQAEKVKGAE
jgi:hypothetical protein